jgi:anti-sigma B factor antagonist
MRAASRGVTRQRCNRKCSILAKLCGARKHVKARRAVIHLPFNSTGRFGEEIDISGTLNRQRTQFWAYNSHSFQFGETATASDNAFPEEKHVPLKISTRQVGDVTIVDLDGRLTIGADSDLVAARLRELETQSVRKILVNLTNVTQLDSSGLSALAGGFISTKRLGGAFKFLRPSGRVREVLSVTRLIDIIPTLDDEAQALVSFTSATTATT